jgi:hypothetical protein
MIHKRKNLVEEILEDGLHHATNQHVFDFFTFSLSSFYPK